MLVPWEASVCEPGLTIHLRRGEVYQEEGSSRAFPGWRAEEIHRALTEEPLSTGARRALERVALAMGEREGTRPEDDPFTRTISLKAQAKGHAQGHREGHADSHMDAVADLLASRGIELTPELAQYRELCGGIPGKTVMGAALACTDETDFRRRFREPRGLHAEHPPYPDPEE